MESRKVKTAILICSDRASAGKYEDKTGPKLKNEIKEGMNHFEGFNQGCKITPPFPPHHSKMVGWSVVIKITPPHHSKSGLGKKSPHPTI